MQRKRRIYILVSILLPVLLFYPHLVALNVSGVSVHQGTPEWAPRILDKYSDWYPPPPEGEAVSKQAKVVVRVSASVVSVIFYLSLVNLIVMPLYVIVGRKEEQSNQ